MLGREFGLGDGELESLLSRVLGENPDLQGFIVPYKDRAYMVSTYFLYRLAEIGFRLDTYLEKVISGEIKVRIG